MIKALINANILTPTGFKGGQSIVLYNDRVIKICDDIDRSPDITVDRDIGGKRLLPGFIDLQVNGGGGRLFNDEPTVETIKAIGTAHRKYGTTGFLPTLISDEKDVMRAAIDAVNEAIEQQVPGVLGIHLEGPFLNAERRGVHDASKFGTIDEEDIRLMTRLKTGKTLVTLAPEMTSPNIIKALTEHGIIVAAGHTQASYETTLLAMDAGLTGFTHLFNAMKPMESRRPGIIAAALEDERAWCGIIADGHHVHPAMLRLALRVKGHQHVFLVTDAMPSVGTDNQHFSLGEHRITVANGKCVTEDGTLAGSDLNMMDAVQNAHELLGVSFTQAVSMASQTPAEFLGLSGNFGSISVGQYANFICVNDSFDVIDSWINGRAH